MTDIDSLLQIITAAEDAYQQLIAEHVDYADRVVTEHSRRQHHVAPDMSAPAPSPASGADVIWGSVYGDQLVSRASGR